MNPVNLLPLKLYTSLARPILGTLKPYELDTLQIGDTVIPI